MTKFTERIQRNFQRVKKGLVDNDTPLVLMLMGLYIIGFGIVTIGLSAYPFLGIIISYIGLFVLVCGVVTALLRGNDKKQVRFSGDENSHGEQN